MALKRSCDALLRLATLALQVWYVAGQSSAGFISSVYVHEAGSALVASSPTRTVAQNWPSTITFETAATYASLGAAAGNLVQLIFRGGGGAGAQCTNVGAGIPANDLGTAPYVRVTGTTFTYPITFANIGFYDVCVRENTETDSVYQNSGAAQIEVLAPTNNNIVAQITPNHVHVNQATAITVDLNINTQAGDKACFLASCSVTGNSVDGYTSACIGGSQPSGAIGGITQTLTVGGPQISQTFQIGYTGSNLQLCFQQAGRNDLVAQTDARTQMDVSPTATVFGDPVVRAGNTVRVFEFPPGKLLPLFHASDMLLRGEVFEHGPWQQWFGRVVLSSPDGSRWVQIAIKKNIVEFNRSRSLQGGFETLDVTLGHGPVENPSVRTNVGNIDVHIPLNFLGFDVVFWKMARKAKAANTMIGAAHRECMEVAGANIHFYVCSSPAQEFYGWQRDLSIKNAHLDLAIVEFLMVNEVKGTLPQLWGMEPLSTEVKAMIKHEEQVVSPPEIRPLSTEATASKDEQQRELDLPPLPRGSLPDGVAWVGGSNPEDLLKSCPKGNESKPGCMNGEEDRRPTMSARVVSV